MLQGFYTHVRPRKDLSVSGLLSCPLTYIQDNISRPSIQYTAISRKVVGKKVHATIPKGNMGYDQYIVPDTVAVEPTFAAFL